MNRYIAEVYSNNDPDKEGKIQIFIPSIMENFSRDHYPWVRQDKEFTSFIPEVGELVWVYFTDELYFKKGYYQNKVTLKEYHLHNTSIGSMSGSYPDLKYIKLKNGVSIALNSNQTEATIVAGSAEIFINSSGEIRLKAGSSALEKSILGETLKGILEQLIDQINLITVPTGVGPSSTPINSAAFTAIKGQLSTILSPKVKNN